MSPFRIFCCFALLLVPLLAFGQSGQTISNYKLQKEDIIRILVYREQDISAELQIGQDGNISAPFIGVFRAEGKTVTELENELTEEYKRRLRLRDPKVSIVVLRFRAIRAIVTGMVKAANAFEMRHGDTVLTLLTRAGGVDPDRADLRRATLRRAGTNELIPIDLYSLLILADLSQNYEIFDGDELVVPEATRNRINVLGAVATPGTFGYKEPMTVVDALGLAHWEIPGRSHLSKTMVVREMPGQPGKFIRIQVDVVKFVRDGDSKQNILLAPGDLVYVPHTKTPDINRISDIASTLFFLDRFFRESLFSGGGR